MRKDGFKFVNVPGQESTDVNFYSSKELIEVVNAGFPTELLEKLTTSRDY